ncbi:Transcription factor CP2 [Blomia tropicalis]|nr:Transcription factor CP2 [Blomia tropicalis]
MSSRGFLSSEALQKKGADRKNKLEREKKSKMSMAEKQMFKPSCDFTLFTDCSTDSLLNPSSSAITTTISVSSPISENRGHPEPHELYSFDNIIDNCVVLNISNSSIETGRTMATVPCILTRTTSVEDTQKWLHENRFGSFPKTFAKFSGLEINTILL